MAWGNSNTALRVDADEDLALASVQDAGGDAAADRALIILLRGKLEELAGRGFRIVWIAASEADLVALFREGGEDVIQLDADPAVDRAWFEGHEIRPSQGPGVWVYVDGEYDEISRHWVGSSSFQA